MAQGLGFRCRIPALVDALNRRFFPCVPGWGSIGVADLPQMSHIALALIGEGEAYVDGKRVAGAQAHAAAGLAPVLLAPGDGLRSSARMRSPWGHACLSSQI
jgi:histidine ammonia-lyase